VDLVGIEPTTSSMPWKRAPSCATGPQRKVLFIVSYPFAFVKWARFSSKIESCTEQNGRSGVRTARQLSRPFRHRPKIMLMDMLASPPSRLPTGCLSILLAGAVAALPFASLAQAPPAPENAPAPRVTVSSIVQPALIDVQRSVSALNISRWKAPGDVRGATQQYAASIQRDLTDTLPPLLNQADAAPGAVPPSFSVYRNIDALYDVLLRVYETASLAAPQNEADGLGSALERMESARRQLGETILSDSKDHEAQIVELQTALKNANQAHLQQAAPAKTSVIDDGPAPAPAAKKKKKSAAKPPATTGSSQNPPS
jgi:hypothetical protein